MKFIPSIGFVSGDGFVPNRGYIKASVALPTGVLLRIDSNLNVQVAGNKSILSSTLKLDSSGNLTANGFIQSSGTFKIDASKNIYANSFLN